MSRRAASLFYACVLMAAFGTGVAAFGPLLPELARNNGLVMGQMGLIFPAVFAGTVPASLIVGFAIDRIGAERIILFAIPVLAGAAVGLTFSRSIPLLLVLSVLVGVGGGAGLPTANAMIVNLYGKQSVTAVNLLNVFFGVGAVTGPALASLGLGLFGTGTPTFWFAATVALLCIPYFARTAARRGANREERRIVGDEGSTSPSMRAGDEAAGSTFGMQDGAGEGTTAGEASAAETSAVHGSIADATRRQESGRERPKGRADTHHRAALLFRSPLLWLIGGILFFDVGTEQTLGGWLTVYLQESTRLALAVTALVVSGFWITFTVGRLVGAAAGTKVTARWVLAASLFAALAGITAVNLSTGHEELSIAAFLLTGFGFGPIYPTTMALIGTTFASRAGTAIGATAALGTVGGMALPWLEGVLMAAFGPPGAARFLAAATGAVALLTLTTISTIAFRQRSR